MIHLFKDTSIQLVRQDQQAADRSAIFKYKRGLFKRDSQNPSRDFSEKYVLIPPTDYKLGYMTVVLKKIVHVNSLTDTTTH